MPKVRTLCDVILRFIEMNTAVSDFEYENYDIYNSFKISIAVLECENSSTSDAFSKIDSSTSILYIVVVRWSLRTGVRLSEFFRLADNSDQI